MTYRTKMAGTPNLAIFFGDHEHLYQTGMLRRVHLLLIKATVWIEWSVQGVIHCLCSYFLLFPFSEGLEWLATETSKVI